jgi:formylglycine-generating enzyme required for sulfatase activity
LPSEAEWEYACRGGATSEEECSYHFYFDKPTNYLASKQANFNGMPPRLTCLVLAAQYITSPTMPSQASATTQLLTVKRFQDAFAEFTPRNQGITVTGPRVEADAHIYLGRPTKVGSYAPNKLGLYDMHGNVWQ